MSHEWTLKFVEHRVADSRILRLIQKWLRAGVSEDGEWSETKVGTPQGAVISPLLANIYLHYAFDLWVEAWRKKIARGSMVVVRYADDLVVGFQHREDADLFLSEFKERLSKFGLELNDAKTRLIEFGRKAESDRRQRGEGKPETFTFLGFTHICGKRRSNGGFFTWRKTAKRRMTEKLRQIKAALRKRMHEPVDQTGEWLRRVVWGYYLYHAVPGNLDTLGGFYRQVLRQWHRVLSRRSQSGRLAWSQFLRRSERWVPVPRVLHPYPEQRFATLHPR